MFSPNCVIVLPASEISIKSDAVRRFMIKRLKKNMISYFDYFGVHYSGIEYFSSRLVVYSREPEKVISALDFCFGINLMFLAEKKPFSSLVDLCNNGVLVCDGLVTEGTFAVRGKSFCEYFSSKKLEEELGSALLRAYPELKVSLKSPNKEVFCLVNKDRAFFYFKSISGAKGMPVGSQRNAAILVPRDSKKNYCRIETLALNLMKSGCTICFVSEKKLGVGSLDFPNIEKFNLFKKINVFSIETALALYKQGRIAAFFSVARSVKGAEDDSRVLGLKVFAPLLFELA